MKKIVFSLFCGAFIFTGLPAHAGSDTTGTTTVTQAEDEGLPNVLVVEEKVAPADANASQEEAAVEGYVIPLHVDTIPLGSDGKIDSDKLIATCKRMEPLAIKIRVQAIPSDALQFLTTEEQENFDVSPSDAAKSPRWGFYYGMGRDGFGYNRYGIYGRGYSPYYGYYGNRHGYWGYRHNNRFNVFRFIRNIFHKSTDGGLNYSLYVANE